MFSIPEDLSVFSIEGLQDLRRVATAERDALVASTTRETITDEQLERGEALNNFITLADTEISTRNNRGSRFDALTPTTPAAPEPEDNTETNDTGNTDEGEGEGVTASSEDNPTTDEPGTTQPAAPSVADLATGTTLPTLNSDNDPFPNHTIVAAADIPGVSSGATLTSWLDVAKAFVGRTRSYSGRSPMRHAIAEIQRNFGEQFSLTDAEARDPRVAKTKLDYVADESRLEGGSLTAASNGWCSPSENLFTTCNQISADGLWSGPEVAAPRGGIRHNQGIEFDAVFGDGTGFNILTEDEVISGTTKTCLDIPCPEFVDDRLKVAVLCMTGQILQNRAYPEFVSEFMQGAMAVHAHNLNRQILADLEAGSTAVNLSASLPWSTDSSVASQTLSAVEHAIVDMKYRLRLPRNATLEVVLPYWVLAQYRADVARRNASPTEFNAADAMLANWFSIRGARPQYVYDWQDAFADAGVGYGADTPLQSPPTEVRFLVYPAGTWTLARLDVIRLESVYDSVNLPQNLVTQLFLEDGFRVMRMCPESRAYTVPICPSGNTGDMQAVTCGS